MDGLASAAEPVKPFALQEQYVLNIAKAKAEGQAKAEAEKDPGDDKELEEPRNPPKEPVEPAVKKQAVKKKSDWDYKAIRDSFIDQKKKEGFVYSKAKEFWDASQEKASFLGAVPLPELKKRRFVSKGAHENPWAPKDK